MKQLRIFLGLLVLFSFAMGLVGWQFYSYSQKSKIENSLAIKSAELIKSKAVLPPEVFPYSIESGQTLSSSLDEHNVDSLTLWHIVKAAEPIKDLGRLRAGTRYLLKWEHVDEKALKEIKFEFSPVEKLRIFKQEGDWVAESQMAEVETRVRTFAGVVDSSLWGSAQSAEMDPQLIAELAEIFSWQVDFAREVRKHDRWRLSVEEKFVGDTSVGWGDILSAEYENQDQLHKAALFRYEGENLGYFAPDGTSLRRMFLKSPIKFARISSRFQRARFHPILKLNRPHLGVDYAAPRGTPVRAVGDGVVTFVGRRGGGGKVIQLRHNSTYATAYKHLHGYAKGIRSGIKVKQGQTIGYVGSTGLSTGPHLHFEFFQNGRFVDPLGKTFPSADPVPSQHLSAFKVEALNLLKLLPQWNDDLLNRQTASAQEADDKKITK